MKGASRVYRFWQSMKDRCDNPDSSSYVNYGGRGIRCYWSDDFDAFFSYFKSTFGVDDIPEGKSMDRTNNDGNYEPGNIRIADIITQANNRRNNHVVSYQGEQLTITQLARKRGIKPATLNARINAYGYTVEEAVELG